MVESEGVFKIVDIVATPRELPSPSLRVLAAPGPLLAAKSQLIPRKAALLTLLRGFRHFQSIQEKTFKESSYIETLRV